MNSFAQLIITKLFLEEQTPFFSSRLLISYILMPLSLGVVLFNESARIAISISFIPQAT